MERIPSVLKYMVDFALDKTEVMEVDEADANGFVIEKKRKQSHQKQSRKLEKQNSSFKLQDLARLNVTDPQSKEEAFLNISLLLDTLKGTFSVRLGPNRSTYEPSHRSQRYFDLLREPEICSTIQSMFVVMVSTDTGKHEEKDQQPSNGPTPEETPADVTPAAYPCVQPMSA